jgi:type VI secretion system protein ImpA
MAIESELESLAKPLSGDDPCGASLEDTQLLASFDAYHLFGQSVQLPETDWRELKGKSLEALEQSKDIRLLVHLAAASLRTDGWPGFLGSIHVAAVWIKDHWDGVYPRIDEDAILRKNALSCLSDRMAIIDGVRRTPIIENKQLGRFALRDIEIANGKQAAAPVEGEPTPPTESEITAALMAAPLEDLQPLEQQVATAVADLQAIDSAMREYGGAASSPDFDALMDALGGVRKVLREQLDLRGAAAAAGAAEGGAAGAAGGGMAVGGIKSRQDAIRAIDTIAAFFRQNEPSSPVPILLDRAKNLVGKSFLDALKEIAPEGVAAAKLAGGIKDE